jgi:hypothetical protein
MMMRRQWWIPGLLLAVAGCNQDRQVAQPKATGGTVQGSPSKADPFAVVLLTAKPEKVLSVREVLTAKDGDVVAVSGRTPPEKVKPFNPGVAAFILMDPTDLDKKAIKEEFECDDAAT